MTLPDFSQLAPNDHFLEDLGQGVWLMDDHRWAILVWEEQRKRSQYTLVHADQHWDGCYDFDQDPAAEQELVNADVFGIKKYLIEDKFIRFDSFIAPAVKRGLFDVIHFYCTEDNGNEIGIYEEWLTSVGGKQVIHENYATLASAEFNCPVIFDLCLDLFNRSDQFRKGDLWSPAEICKFLESVKHIIAAAELVTISLSFDYSGSHNDTRNLATLVIPILMSFRPPALPAIAADSVAGL